MPRMCHWFLLPLMILAVGATPAKPLEATHQEIADLVVREILSGETEGVRVVATPFPFEDGDAVIFRWSGGEVEVPPGTVWFALADETPGVLGYHPVRHVFLDADLFILEVRDAVFYPRIYVEETQIDLVTLIAYQARPGEVPADREFAEAPPSALASDEDFSYNQFYAVIIEGDTPATPSIYPEFWTDNVRLFRILLEYGYQADHIHVLYGYGHDEDSWPCAHYRETMVDYPAYKQDVRDLFTWMRDGNAGEEIPQVTDQDFIFLFTFDHGGSSGGCNATLCLMDGCMPDTEFASYFNQIPYKHRAVDMQQCHSGGFIDNLENDTTVISTAANCSESAWEGDEKDDCGGGVQIKYGEWNYWWMSAMEGHLPWPGEEPVDADDNRDGKVSFLEAHNYAAANDDRQEHPLWSDPGGIGDQLNLSASWAGAHLVYQTHLLQDDAGNSDSLADAGETIMMPVTLHNNGDEDALGVTSTLHTDNTWVTIEDGASPFPDIPTSGSAESLSDSFQWSSDAGTPNATEVQFFLDWSASGGTHSGTTTFSETIVRIDLGTQRTSVDDVTGGNGDGIADPGESIRLAVTLRNRGDATARSARGVLWTGSPWAAIIDDAADFPDIPGQTLGTSLSDHFGLAIDPGTPDRTWIECILEVTTIDGYHVSLPVRFMVGSRGTILLVEDGDSANADLLEALIGTLGFGVEREPAPDTDPASWSTFDILVWAAGGNPDPVFTQAQRDALEQHVAGGGRLLIEGGNLGYEHRYNTSFRQNVLHMTSWTAHGGGDLQVFQATHPLATLPEALDVSIPLGTSQNADRDAVTMTSDARVVLDWTTRPGSASVIAYDDDDLEGNGGQVVSLFVACDAMEDSGGQRAALVGNILEWLAGNDLPYLLYDGHTVVDGDSGNGDGIPDPGEILGLAVNLSNRGAGTATASWARATSNAPAYIFFSDNYAAWPDIPSSASLVSHSPHLALRIGEDAPCGTVIEITLEITTAEGFRASRRFTTKLGTGGGQHTTLVATDTPMDAPNNGTADSVIDVTDVFLVGDVNCQVDVVHASSLSKLAVDLRSPAGTEVTLHDGSDTGTELATTYDSVIPPDGPGSMSDFDGEEGTGAWHLRVTDLHASPNGDARLNGWQLIFDTTDLCHEQACIDPVPGPVGPSLLLSRISGTDVHLEWGPAGGAAGYNLWRSSHPDFSKPETVGTSETSSFDEVGLPWQSPVYYYLVKARNACHEEGP